MNKKEYDEGYQAAIESIKKALSGKDQNGGSGKDNNQNQNPNLNTTIDPSNNDGPMSKEAQKNGKGSGSVPTPSDSGSQSQDGGEGKGGQNGSLGTPGGSKASSASREARSGEVGGFGGSFIDPKVGDQIAKESGYDASESGAGESTTDVEQKWEKIGKQVQQAISSIGSGKGNALAEALGAMHKAKFDWKHELRKIVGQAAGACKNTEDRWGNKTHLALWGDIRMYDKEMDSNLSDAVFMIDTSGSNLGNLETLLSESLHVLKQKGINTCTYVPYDADVQNIINVNTRKIPSLKEVLKELPGGGGTSFETALKHFGEGWNSRKMDIYGKQVKIKRNSPKCQLLICFTDGEDHFDKIAKEKPKWVRNLIFVVMNRREPSYIQCLKDAGYKVLFIDSNDI